MKKKKEIEKKMKVTQSCLAFCDPVDDIQFMEFSRPEYWSE